ncbi:MAG: acetate uptake transporter, partial [Chloroflexota bacterium]|nr:acetate uptake transporter [Chloroflexota bacterium]
LDNPGLAWTFVMWGIFTAFMTIGTFKMSIMHVIVFSTLTVLFFLLAATFFGALPAVVPGVVGILCGGTATYGAAAVVLSSKYGRWVFPIGSLA